MDGFQDFYALLGVAPLAEPEVIRAAYRVLARRYHPDRMAPSHRDSRMAEINQAYAVLSCPERRRAYDQWCHQFTQRQHLTTAQRRDLTQPSAIRPPQPNVLTTYDRRGRLHAFI